VIEFGLDCQSTLKSVFGLSIHFEKCIWIVNHIFAMDLDWIEQQPAYIQHTGQYEVQINAQEFSHKVLE